MKTSKIKTSPYSPANTPSLAQEASSTSRIRTWFANCLLVRAASFVWRWAVSHIRGESRVKSAAQIARVIQSSELAAALRENRRPDTQELGMAILRTKGADLGFQELTRDIWETIDYPFLADLGMRYYVEIPNYSEKEAAHRLLRQWVPHLEDLTVGLIYEKRFEESFENGIRAVEIIGLDYFDALYARFIRDGFSVADSSTFVIQVARRFAQKHETELHLAGQAREIQEKYRALNQGTTMKLDQIVDSIREHRYQDSISVGLRQIQSGKAQESFDQIFKYLIQDGRLRRSETIGYIVNLANRHRIQAEGLLEKDPTDQQLASDLRAAVAVRKQYSDMYDREMTIRAPVGRAKPASRKQFN